MVEENTDYTYSLLATMHDLAASHIIACTHGLYVASSYRPIPSCHLKLSLKLHPTHVTNGMTWLSTSLSPALLGTSHSCPHVIEEVSRLQNRVNAGLQKDITGNAQRLHILYTNKAIPQQ